jgi:uncharacterized protein YajQ (UPF0234 family)
MAKTESFDITTGVDRQEVDNAVNQARKEISNRFDFKNVVAEIEYDRAAPKLTIRSVDEFKLEAIWSALNQRLLARNVPLKNLKRGSVDKAAGGTVRQEIPITQAIDEDTARRILRFVKNKKYKRVTAAVQGDEIRVSAPSRDDLQAVIRDLKNEDWQIELKFGNYR